MDQTGGIGRGNQSRGEVLIGVLESLHQDLGYKDADVAVFESVSRLHVKPEVLDLAGDELIELDRTVTLVISTNLREYDWIEFTALLRRFKVENPGLAEFEVVLQIVTQALPRFVDLSRPVDEVIEAIERFVNPDLSSKKPAAGVAIIKHALDNLEGELKALVDLEIKSGDGFAQVVLNFESSRVLASLADDLANLLKITHPRVTDYLPKDSGPILIIRTDTLALSPQEFYVMFDQPLLEIVKNLSLFIGWHEGQEIIGARSNFLKLQLVRVSQRHGMPLPEISIELEMFDEGTSRFALVKAEGRPDLRLPLRLLLPSREDFEAERKVLHVELLRWLNGSQAVVAGTICNLRTWGLDHIDQTKSPLRRFGL